MDTGSALSVFAHSIMGSSPVVPACSEVNISMWNFTVPGEGPYKGHRVFLNRFLIVQALEGAFNRDELGRRP